MNLADEPLWLQQWVAACQANIRSAEMDALFAAGGRADVVTMAKAAAVFVRAALPYRFDPHAHKRIEALGAARRQGFGACGEGSAFVAAAALRADVAGTARVSLCYEQHPSSATYAHVAVDVGPHRVDPYPDASLRVSSCSSARDVRELLRWPVSATHT